MAGSDKRAKLLSGLVAARGATAPVESPPPEGARSSVIKIADRRPAEDRSAEPAPSVLYSKGAATASTFRPTYWSYAHDEQPDAPAESAEPQSPASAPAAPPASVAVSPQVRAARPLPINFVVAFGLVALLMSTTLFVLSQWRRDDAAATAQADRAPETAIVTPVRDTSLPANPPTAQPVAVAVAIPREVSAESIPSAAPAIAAPVPPAALSEKPQLKQIAAAPVEASAVPNAEPAPIPAAIPSPTPVVAAVPIPAPVPATLSTAPPPAAPDQPVASQPPSASSPEIETLLARGDELLANGDVVAARLFYQRAAEQGSAAAATAVGQTYDPFFLDQVHVRGARSDARAAEDWYRKAVAAGDRQAEARLKRLIAKPAG
jgi:hypothetical protein